MGKKPRSEIICACNSVSREEIEKAIQQGGCRSLGCLFDRTTAGVGPCGGSCRNKLVRLLESFAESGSFPAGPIQAPKRRSS